MVARANIPTQSDISKIAGVSRSTVSMVLNGNPRIGAQTRERVLNVARELNYSLHDNLAARRMAASQTGKIIPFRTIGLVWPKDFAMHKVSFYQALFDGICEGCWDAEYSLMLLNVKPTHANQLAGLSQVDALILPIPSDKHYSVLKNMHIPLITTYFERPGVAHIGIDHNEAVKIAFNHLYENGHRKIGFISPDINKSKTAKIRWKTYCKLLTNAGLDYNPDYVRTENKYENAEQAKISFLDIWHNKNSRPTGIIFYNDLMALSALQVANKEHIKVPGDVSFISIDNNPDTEKSNPPLTTVSVNIKEIGRKSVILAIDFIENNTYYPEFIEIPLKLIIRKSVKKL